MLTFNHDAQGQQDGSNTNENKGNLKAGTAVMK